MKLLAFFGTAWVASLWLGVTLPQTGADAFTIVERYGIFGLLSVVILGLGGYGMKSLVKVAENVATNTIATEKLNLTLTGVTQAMESLTDRITSMEKEYANERVKAVEKITEHVDRLVDEVRESDKRERKK